VKRETVSVTERGSRFTLPHHVSRITFHASRPPPHFFPTIPPAVSILRLVGIVLQDANDQVSRIRSIVPLDFHFCQGERVFSHCRMV